MCGSETMTRRSGKSACLDLRGRESNIPRLPTQQWIKLYVVIIAVGIVLAGCAASKEIKIKTPI